MTERESINTLGLLKTMESVKARHLYYLVILFINQDKDHLIKSHKLNSYLKGIGWNKRQLYTTRMMLVHAGHIETLSRDLKKITPQGITKAKTIIKEYHQRAKNPPKPPKGLILNF